MKFVASEKEIENSILSWLNLQSGCTAWKQNIVAVSRLETVAGKARIKRFNTSKWVPRGGCDIIGLYRGRSFAIEVKTEIAYKLFESCRDPHELRQKEFIDRVRRAGGIAFLACSLEMVEVIFKNWKVRVDWEINFVNDALRKIQKQREELPNTLQSPPPSLSL